MHVKFFIAKLRVYEFGGTDYSRRVEGEKLPNDIGILRALEGLAQQNVSTEKRRVSKPLIQSNVNSITQYRDNRVRNSKYYLHKRIILPTWDSHRPDGHLKKLKRVAENNEYVKTSVCTME